jgi:single-stranded DNA-binding protein
VKRYVTEIVADNIVLLGGNGNASVNGANREEKSRSRRGQSKPANGRGDREFDPEQQGFQEDDVPF